MRSELEGREWQDSLSGSSIQAKTKAKAKRFSETSEPNTKGVRSRVNMGVFNMWGRATLLGTLHLAAPKLLCLRGRAPVANILRNVFVRVHPPRDILQKLGQVHVAGHTHHAVFISHHHIVGRNR